MPRGSSVPTTLAGGTVEFRAMGVGSGAAGGFVLQPKYGGAKKAVKKTSSTPGKAGKSKEK